jgi:hypothetical protein
MINPNATEGAGRGTPIGSKERDAFLDMRDFMRRVGSYQEARNLQTAPKGGAGLPATQHRSTDTKPAIFPFGGKSGPRFNEGVKPRPAYPPFGLVDLSFPETGSPLVSLQKGSVVEMLTVASAPDAVIVHDVEFDGGPMTFPEPTELEVDFGSYVFVHWATDKFGNITTGPELLVSGTDYDSTHYQPSDGEEGGGVDGSYYVKVGQLTGADETDAEWVPSVNSDIPHYHELWTGRNIGSGASLYKGRNASSDTYEFHKAQAGWGNKIEASGDSVKWDFLGTNVGGGSEVLTDTEEGGSEVPTSGAVAFRTLRGLNTSEETAGLSKQINVDVADGETGTDNTIRIKGNGVIGSNDYVTVVDGLVTVVGDGSSGGTGWWGTSTWETFQYIGDSTPYLGVRHTYEDGRLTKVESRDPGDPDYTEVTGTEGSPGVAYYSSVIDPDGP